MFTKERGSYAFRPLEGAMLNGLVPTVLWGMDTGDSLRWQKRTVLTNQRTYRMGYNSVIMVMHK